jgi:HEAT repeat protein
MATGLTALRSLRQAARAIGSERSFGEVVAALLTGLNDQIPGIRKASIESLGAIAQKKTSNEIIAALSNSSDDNNFEVRYAAAESLR